MLFHLVTDKSLVLATRIASQGTRVLATMVLARLVAKGDYGQFELILSVPGFLMAAGDFGITRSIMTIHDLPENELHDTGIVILVGLALVYGVLAIAAGGYYGHIANDSRLVWVGAIMAASFVTQNVQVAQMAMLARELRFAQWAGVEFLMMLATIASGIAIAVAGGGIYALALQQLLAQICGVLICSRAKPLHWPGPWSRVIARRFFSYGWKSSAYQWTNNVQPNIARQAVGAAAAAAAGANLANAGATAVGVFGRATQVCGLIGQNLLGTFDLVLLPLFARAKDDPVRLSDLLVRGTVGVTVFCSFGAAWLVALAPDLILVVLGPSWSEVPPLIQALAPLIAMQGLCYACVIMALAINEPLVSFRYALLNMIGLGLAIIALWCGELLWFAAAQTVYSVIPTYYATRWGTRVVGYSLRALARRTLTIFVEAILIGGVMWMACAELHHWTDHWRPIDANGQSWIPNQQLGAVIRLILSSLAGMLTGWLLLTRIDQRTYQDLSGLLLRRPQATEITATDLVLEP